MKYKVKKLRTGVYQYDFDNGLSFQIVRITDADRGTTQGKWYFVNIEIDAEGGNDLYPSKKKALEALMEYIPHRAYSEVYGWYYNPTEA